MGAGVAISTSVEGAEASTMPSIIACSIHAQTRMATAHVMGILLALMDGAGGGFGSETCEQLRCCSSSFVSALSELDSRSSDATGGEGGGEGSDGGGEAILFDNGHTLGIGVRPKEKPVPFPNGSVGPWQGHQSIASCDTCAGSSAGGGGAVDGSCSMSGRDID